MKRALLIFLSLCGALAIALSCAHYEPHPLPPGVKADRILVEKSARRLTLFHGNTPLKTYRVALGGSPTGQKQQLGDRRTPEGNYTIDYKNAESTCYLSLHISYPNSTQAAQAAREGLVPGGDVMVHGIGNGYGWLGALHRSRDWTNGCVAVTDREMDEIWRAVPVGTPIEIRP